VASLLVSIFFNVKVLDFGFSVGDIVSGIGLSLFGPSYLVLPPNLTEVFVGN